MEQARLILAVVLSFLVFLLWDFLFVDKQKATTTPEGKSIVEEAAGKRDSVPEPSRPLNKTAATESVDKSAEVQAHVEQEKTPPRRIVVDTPLYIAVFNDQTGAISSFKLKKYFESVGEDAPLKELVSPELENGTLILSLPGATAQSGYQPVFQTDFPSSEIKVDENAKTLVFKALTPDGLAIEKTYLFDPASYKIELRIAFANETGQPMEQELKLSLLNRSDKKRSYGFTGSSALGTSELTQVTPEDIEDEPSHKDAFKWVAFQERYFITGLVPVKPDTATMLLSLTDNQADKERTIETAYVFNSGKIPGGFSKTTAFYVVFAPKSYDLLGKIGSNLDKAVHFGFFDVIAKPCLWLMNRIYHFIPNYGVAIILLTIMIKILFWPLGNKSYKSMNEMKKLQPLMAEIREKYKNDKTQMNQEMMGLYKTYKINPLGGCLPMLAQIPVFFALYQMLYSAIELRQAPFLWWINDLSAPDRLFHFGFSVPFMEPPYGIPILTLVMGATMFIQQKLQPPPGDPTQAKMMMLMPIIFTFIFINFSSGLVLYWLVNNILSIVQQYYVMKKKS